MLPMALLLMRQYGLGVSSRISTSLQRLMTPLSCYVTTQQPSSLLKIRKFHQKTKHIKKRYRFVRDAIKTKEIVIKYISTNKMIVDPLTKPIPRYMFKSHMLSLRLRGV